MFDPSEHPELMTRQQVASALKISYAKVRYLTENGALRYRQVGRHKAVPASAVAEYLRGTDHPASTGEPA